MPERHPDHPDPELPPADRELEAALMALRPSSPNLDAGDALFEAGRRSAGRSAKRQLVIWRSAACFLVAALGGSILLRPAPTIVERERVRVVYQGPADEPDEGPPVQVATPSPQPQPLASESMYALRQVALQRGIEHLPASPGGHLGLTGVRDLSIR